MAGIREVRTALANQIQTVSKIKCSPRMPDTIEPPQAAILPGSPYAKYGVTLGEGTLHMPLGQQMLVPTELNLRVAVFVSRAPSLDRSQALLDEWLGLESSTDTVSIPMALMEDSTLGGIVEYCEPLEVLNYSNYAVAGQTYFMGMISVIVSVTQDLGA